MNTAEIVQIVADNAITILTCLITIIAVLTKKQPTDGQIKEKKQIERVKKLKQMKEEGANHVKQAEEIAEKVKILEKEIEENA